MSGSFSYVETLELLGLASAPAVSPSGRARLFFNTATGQLEASGAGGAFAPVGGSASLAWSTIYDLDWSAQGSQNIKTNQNYTVDGKTWTTENGANSNTFDITNGTGLVFTSISGNTANYVNNIRTATLFRVDLSSLVPDLAFGQYIALRFLTRFTITNSDTNFEIMKFGLEHAASPATMHMVAGNGFNGLLGTQNQISTTATTQFDNVTATTDDVFGFIYKPPFITDFVTGASSGGNFPSTFTTRSSFVGGMASGVTGNVIRNAVANNLRMVLLAHAAGAVSTFTATFIRTRIEGIKIPT